MTGKLASIFTVGAVIAIGAGGVDPALAQSESEARAVDEVVVTAQRREQSVQDIPLSVSAFSPLQLEAAQIDETVDLVRFTPGLTGGLNTGTGGAVSYYMRGLGSTEQVSTFDVPVATYIDEIYIARQSVNNFALFDIERVEVLRGPQGTLFGRNTTGGAVSIVTRKPAEEFGGFLEASYGTFNRGIVRGTIDAPLGDRVLTKASGFWVTDDGYSKSLITGEDLNGEDAWGARVAIRLLPTDNITWDVSADYIDQERTTIGVFPVDPQYDIRTGLRAAECDENIKDTYLNTVRGNCSRIMTGGVTSNFEIGTDFATINFITGYREIAQGFALDFGITPAGTQSRFGGFMIANEVFNTQFTQEIKLVGSTSFMDWVAGVFYLTEKGKTDAIDVFATTATAGAALLLADRVLNNETDSYAIYAQGDLKLTPQTTLTVGGRWTSEEKSFGFIDAVRPSYPAGFINATGPVSARPITANLVRLGIPLSQEVEEFTPRFALAHRLDEDKQVYVSATKGFKSGGWNARGTTAIESREFGPEFAWSYELGLKSEWLNDRLRANLTTYYLDVEELQLLSGFTRPDSTVAFVTNNAGGLDVKGLELEITAVPTDNLDVFASFSAADSEYKDIPPLLGAGGVPCSRTPEPLNCTTENDRPVRFPDLQGTLGASYRIPAPALAGSFNLNGAVSYSGYYWTSTYNDTAVSTGVPIGATTPRTVALSKVDPTTLVNVGINFKTDSGAWEAALDCSNCTEEYYFTSSLAGWGYPNDPRRVTLRLRYTY
jgi:iron complex outermembrane receptor protein